MSVFAERYPELAFLLQIIPFETLKTMDEKKIEEECDEWFASLHLESVQVLYICGVGLGYPYKRLKPWLDQDPTRTAIFIDDDLRAVDALSRSSHAYEVASDPQVHLSFLDRGHWEEGIEGLAVQFPEGKIKITALPSFDTERFEKYRLQLLRRTTEAGAYFSEMIRSHELSENVFHNVKHLASASYVNRWRGQFEGTPAVICGSGPSLQKDLKTLKQFETRALVIAGGSAITALTQHAIEPHLALALDPNPKEHALLAPACAFEIPLLYGNRLRHSVFSLFNGPLGYVTTKTGGFCEEWFERELGLNEEAIGADFSSEAFSVTTVGISLATALGCNPIILVGVDLAYTGNEKYVQGVEAKGARDEDMVGAGDTPIWKDDVDGKPVQTLVKWIMEASAIGDYVKEKGGRLYLNATHSGIGIRGLQRITLEEALESHCQNEEDLRGKIHSLLQRTKIDAQPHQIDACKHELKQSLIRSEQLCQAMLQEITTCQTTQRALPTGKMTILEMDLQDEAIYTCFLRFIGRSLDLIAPRRFPLAAFPDPRACALKQLQFKWASFLEALSQLEVFLSKKESVGGPLPLQIL